MVAIHLTERASWYLGRFYSLAFDALIVAGYSVTGQDNFIAIRVATVIAGVAGGYKPGTTTGENNPILPTKHDFLDHVKLSNIDETNWSKVQTSAGYHYTYTVDMKNHTLPFQLPSNINEAKQALTYNGKTITYTKLEHGYHAEVSLVENTGLFSLVRQDGYTSLSYYFGEDDPNDGNLSSDTI